MQAGNDRYPFTSLRGSVVSWILNAILKVVGSILNVLLETLRRF